MILSAVNICYDPIHQPFAAEGAVKIQNLNSERPALKIIRAVLRDSDIDPEDAVNYSLHRCYCNSNTKSEDQIDGAFNSESTLDELEIRGGDSILIRKIDVGADAMEEEQGSNSRRSSRKRKERADERADSTSRKRKSTLYSSNARAVVEKGSSDLGNLSSNAAAAARSISKLLGGEGWKSQSIGKLGSIQTRGHSQLLHLSRLVKTSLQIGQDSEGEPGLFNPDLVEALTRAYHQRVGSSMAKEGERYFFGLGLSDYEKANELLKGKIEQDGSWERSSISHLDDSYFSKPASRFFLSDSGLSGQPLSTARAICALWDNEKWFIQAPLPGLSPVSLKNKSLCAILRQIAELTRVKPGEATPNGFPPTVLKALRESVKQNQGFFNSNNRGSKGGWAQERNLKDTLALLKNRVAVTSSTLSSINESSSEASESRDAGMRNFRARLDGGKSSPLLDW